MLKKRFEFKGRSEAPLYKKHWNMEEQIEKVRKIELNKYKKKWEIT